MNKLSAILALTLAIGGIVVMAGCEKDQTDDGTTIKGTKGGTEGTGYSNVGEPGSRDREVNRTGYGLPAASDREMSPNGAPPAEGTGTTGAGANGR